MVWLTNRFVHCDSSFSWYMSETTTDQQLCVFCKIVGGASQGPACDAAVSIKDMGCKPLNYAAPPFAYHENFEGEKSGNKAGSNVSKYVSVRLGSGAWKSARQKVFQRYKQM